MNKELEREVDYLKGNMEDAIRGIEDSQNHDKLFELLSEVETSVNEVKRNLVLKEETYIKKIEIEKQERQLLDAFHTLELLRR
ncbi:hypothetical protein ACODG4_04255 [Vagococcus fluvialis]|uniref:hypothetical protein n=1 Tax=Vagococcus fluvialis TaxID=2738 RepID=UPI003B5BB828